MARIDNIASNAFDGARLKVKRAYKHIDELETWLNSIVQSNIDTARAYKDKIPGSESDHVHVVRPQGFSECVSPIVGDAVHNLRTALDFIASAIVNAGGKVDPTKSYFPIQNTRKALVHSSEYGFIEGVSAGLALIIADVIKPYKTGGDARFWALNQLDRMDKHRVLVPSIVESFHAVIAIREEDEDNPPSIGPGAIFMLGGCTTKEGVVVSVAREPRVGTKAYIHNQNNGYATVNVMFAKGDAFKNQSIVPTLRELAELVSGVVDTFETFCFGKKT